MERGYTLFGMSEGVQSAVGVSLAIVMLIYIGFSSQKQIEKVRHSVSYYDEYDLCPVPVWRIVADFFNPLKITLPTIICIIGLLILGFDAFFVDSSIQTIFVCIALLFVFFKILLLMAMIKLKTGKFMDSKIMMYPVYPEMKNVTAGYIRSDEADPFMIINPLWIRVDIYSTHEVYLRTLERFSTPQRYIYAIEAYMSEVSNGGHWQFFANSTGIVWKDALDGFKAIGADDYAAMLQSACDKMGDALSFDRSKRCSVLYDPRPDSDKSGVVNFAEEDNMYMELPEIGDKELAYIRARVDDFLFSALPSE